LRCRRGFQARCGRLSFGQVTDLFPPVVSVHAPVVAFAAIDRLIHPLELDWRRATAMRVTCIKEDVDGRERAVASLPPTWSGDARTAQERPKAARNLTHLVKYRLR
jgi:hypothetical protein